MKLINIFSFLHGNKEEQPQRIKFKFKFVPDLPDAPSERVVYIVGDKPFYWAAALVCPCGCNELITLNLLQTIRPRWRFRTRWRKISITPSIWRTKGCKSHFHITRSKVRWSFFNN